MNEPDTTPPEDEGAKLVAEARSRLEELRPHVGHYPASGSFQYLVEALVRVAALLAQKDAAYRDSCIESEQLLADLRAVNAELAKERERTEATRAALTLCLEGKISYKYKAKDAEAEVSRLRAVCIAVAGLLEEDPCRSCSALGEAIARLREAGKEGT